MLGGELTQKGLEEASRESEAVLPKPDDLKAEDASPSEAAEAELKDVLMEHPPEPGAHKREAEPDGD
eukprot:7729513-Alexandrium_andersonii.AAC.1